jgi:uncharacterized protein involved in tolerance to divalent cations
MKARSSIPASVRLAWLQAKYVWQQSMVQQAEADLYVKTAQAPSPARTPSAVTI